MNFNFFLQSSIESDLTIMWITIAGFLVFFMHAGFTLVEAGFTQSKNAVNIAMKNLMAISVGTIVYWLIGYSLMYGETTNGFFRWSGFFTETAPHDLFFQTMGSALPLPTYGCGARTQAYQKEWSSPPCLPKLKCWGREVA